MLGVVSEDDVCLLGVRVFDDDGSTDTSTILKAMEWAVEHGANVINLSLGGGAPNQAFADEILDAHNAGAIVVASAG